MSHVSHIATHKQHLDLRWQILKLVREFFWSEGFTEVETPLILRLPGQEPYLSPMKISIHNEQKKEYQGYLHTSPEYTMKKMLAAGYDKIFSLGKVFRDCESFGGTHNPEFTMIEWYRADADFYTLMDDVEKLFKFIANRLSPYQGEVARPLRLAKHGGRGGGLSENPANDLPKTPPYPPLLGEETITFKRVHMRELWKRHAGVNLDDYLERDALLELCKQKGYNPSENESYEDLFFRIFLNEIEPKIGPEPTIIHHYPLPLAALAKKSDTEPDYAERFELYVNGLELANAFTELTDADEQLDRLKKEKEQRVNAGKDVYDIDMEFIEALKTMPPSTGIALGMDRLVQLFVGCKNIDDVLVLPASELFKT